MTQAVWKYTFLDWSAKFEMPEGAGVVRVDTQQQAPDQELICLWALVDPKRPLVGRKFDVVATGEAAFGDYVGTATRRSGTVWHVFER